MATLLFCFESTEELIYSQFESKCYSDGIITIIIR
jgi:hypothetical protein